jgi:hypothetical protein
MTSISSMTPRPDPRAQMDARISAATSAGSISTGDQDALDSALDSIDSSLSTSGAKPGDMKDKVDGLIDDQVKSGALTDDQAAELKGFFAQGPDGGKQGGAASGGSEGTQAVQGGHGPHHAHGHHAPPPANDTDTDTNDTAGTDTQISAAATRQLDAMTAFLQKLRDTAASGNSTYGGNAGTSGTSSSATGLVIDRKA